MRKFQETSGFEEGAPYVYRECVYTIDPIKGTATPVAQGTVIDSFGVPGGHRHERSKC